MNTVDFIYNSRNFNGLAAPRRTPPHTQIYNSRNFNGLAAHRKAAKFVVIYNSRNFNGLAAETPEESKPVSTIVEILTV